MKKKFWLVFVLGGMLTLGVSTSYAANEVYLAPVSQTVNVLDPVTLDLWMDFHEDSTLGGGIDAFFNNAVLSYVKFEFDTTLPGWGKLSGLYYLPTELPGGEINGLNFGNSDGLAGPYKIGTFTFQAINPGMSLVTLQENDIPFGGGFWSANTYEYQNVNFSGAEVNVIPEPISAFLFLFGMGGIGICKKKKGV